MVFDPDDFIDGNIEVCAADRSIRCNVPATEHAISCFLREEFAVNSVYALVEFPWDDADVLRPGWSLTVISA